MHRSILDAGELTRSSCALRRISSALPGYGPER